MLRTLLRTCALAAIALAPALARGEDAPARPVDFNREIRPILSNRCFRCHGPDEAHREGVTKKFRLDTAEGLAEDLGGYRAVVPGDPEESELIRRVESDDPLEVMPPPKGGERLTEREAGLLRAWVAQGAHFSKHWAYVPPTQPEPPAVADAAWPKNAIDRFVRARLEREGLSPSPEADRTTLIRRLSLDLTGLPPAPAEVDAFLADDRPDAYERLVDALLAKPTFGEHWARHWLDLARYADSAGYADDPPRTIWAYRDYVIRSFNANTPFDRFTVEQIAGDLLPNPTEEQLIATAFHRNTMTNNEGGTNDEEFRTVAVVDRVNTTMSVWMGTTMGCAQCHDHKYDPLTQREYFQLYAFFNSSQDADRTDESPYLSIESDEQKARRARLEREVAALEREIRTPTPEALSGRDAWAARLATTPDWSPLAPRSARTASGAAIESRDDRSLFVGTQAKADTYTVQAEPAPGRLTALRLEVLPDDALPGKGPGHAAGNFTLTRVAATLTPPGADRTTGRFVRVELPGKGKILSLAEVQVFSGGENVATKGEARQSSVAFDGPARLAIDGNTDGDYTSAKSTTHTETTDDPWWEVDLGSVATVDRVVVWNRTDGDLGGRLAGARVSVLDGDRKPVWSGAIEAAPKPKAELAVDRSVPITFAVAAADFTEAGFDAASVISAAPDPKGWAIGDQTGRAHELLLVPATPVEIAAGSTLTVTLEQKAKRREGYTIGRFRLSATADDRAGEIARTPAEIVALARTADTLAPDQAERLTRYYLESVAPERAETRSRLAEARAQLAGLKPTTTVPILRELAEAERRKTFVQNRGNYLDLGPEVDAGTPEAFHPLPAGARPDRLALARWLVAPENPLTPRVLVNRTWEQLFGLGLVPTSEEFGAQGEQPTHPELLDWLAAEVVRGGWDFKGLLRTIVTSATYRQDSRVSPELLKADPDNRLLARGARFRLPAETIRDQALAIAGLLSPKMYGPPVKPPQPSSGLNAAFGSMIDWQTSQGEDRYRRGLYTTWRRSNPYPSMTAFDAPSREVCTVRRARTNTPLQALVTLNDPVYVEAAQGLARRMSAASADPRERARAGFRFCVSRAPTESEVDRLVALHDQARAALAGSPAEAAKLATEPIGPAPEGADVADLAAWTVVGNVLLNLDETLMKR